MAEIKNLHRKASIAIMGAGAIGSVIGGMLARKGHKVTYPQRHLITSGVTSGIKRYTILH